LDTHEKEDILGVLFFVSTLRAEARGGDAVATGARTHVNRLGRDMAVTETTASLSIYGNS